MNQILNITNGDCTVDVMKKAGIPGVFLPWRDVLHVGPVPGGLSLQELSGVRAQFITEQNWGSAREINDSFEQRDAMLISFEKYQRVILWFEHDLYDQLQILQILDWFEQRPESKNALSIICTDQYLGMLTPEEMKGMLQYEAPVTGAQLKLAHRAWAAFCSDTPENWHRLLDTDISSLPFLEGAIIRLLEEYPACDNGLSRTASQALRVLSEAEQYPGSIFSGSQKLEQRVFMGDSSFWIILQQLAESSPALIAASGAEVIARPPEKTQTLKITPAGLDVLKGRLHWLDISNNDDWIGGVHLKAGNHWCRDPATHLLKRYTTPSITKPTGQLS